MNFLTIWGFQMIIVAVYRRKLSRAPLSPCIRCLSLALALERRGPIGSFLFVILVTLFNDSSVLKLVFIREIVQLVESVQSNWSVEGIVSSPTVLLVRGWIMETDLKEIYLLKNAFKNRNFKPEMFGAAFL